ncbi:MAG: dihydrolipoamide acetyltransferase family protein [Candidatus Palauibacterales bacterium]|nr:dihydrolipoamide acetyltransferase family protein [Candidatus Palauibacterales bacterium]MDP2483899.1 dihydrolipoamide acetyltransferase family protein [Candidatus Palauibacterales bacterium]
MATKVVMAQLSPTMEEGKLLEWKVAEGDRVEASDLLAEIETDKANMDIEALGGGVVLKILVEEGQTVPVGALIGIIGEEGEDISALLEEAAAAASVASGAVEPGFPEEADAVVPPAPPEAPPPAAPVPPVVEPPHSKAGESSVTGTVKASPVARRMADDAGLRVSDIQGSGPGGRVVKRDVEAAIAAGGTVARATEPSGGAAVAHAGAPSGPRRLADETLEPSQMRKAIARRLVTSIGPVPHFFLTTEIDMGRALELRKALNARLTGGKIGVNDVLVKVAAEALARHPEINASWEGDTIRRHGSVDIGIAVAIEDGLITPVLRAADRKGLLEISTEASELIGRAREKRLLPEEYQGATFSVSNLGMFDIDQFTAIINPPEAAILAVGGTIEKPVVVDGEIEVRPRMRVTMSCDHRVIDGATGARFLETFKAMLENPLELVL